MSSVPVYRAMLPRLAIVSDRVRSVSLPGFRRGTGWGAGRVPGPRGGCGVCRSKGRSVQDVCVPERFGDSDAAHGADDEAVLQAYVAGDSHALQGLMRRYRDDLMRFLTRFLGSHTAAEDVFQETFLQVHMSAASFDASRRFKPWLFTIAANKARDHHRRTGRRRVMSLSASVSPAEDRARFVDLLDAGLPRPEAPLEANEQARLVQRVIDELPVHLREILLLSYFQRLSYAQIADTLEVPLGTVKSRLHAAVAAFARAWKTARAIDSEHAANTEEEGQ